MRIFYSTIIFLFFSYSVFAQMRGQGMPNNALMHIFGKVLDQKKSPVSYASIIVLKQEGNKSVLVTGTDTDDNGEFSIENLSPKDKLKIQISFLGYKPFEKGLEFKPGQSEYDLGNLLLEEDGQSLDEVVVSASAMAMKMDIDKKVYNVTTNTVSTGGTAEDVLKTVPSVNVDIEGNISLRNSTPTILLDGRPTLLTVDQIPADAIENIEILTNPSAKYDASGGTGGIINIVMKKNKKSGYNGSARAGIESVGGTNAGLDFNFRQNKVNFSFGTNYRTHRTNTDGLIERNNIDEIGVVTKTTQDLFDKGRGGFTNFKLGIDYFLTNKTSFSVSANKSLGKFDPSTEQLFNVTNVRENTAPAENLRKSITDRTFNNNSYAFGAKHLLNTTGDELTFDVTYNARRFDGDVDITNDFYESTKGTNILKTDVQEILSNVESNSLVIQSDLIRTIGSNIKLEAGVRSNINDRVTNNRNFFLIGGNKTEIVNPNAAFENKDYVYGAYTTFSKQFAKTGVKVGVRAESFAFDGYLPTIKEEFNYSYPISLFPSAFISHKINENNDLQISFSRRVNRPSFWQNVPFADSTDKFNIVKGNPNLIPEFSSNFEVGHMKRFKGNHSLLSTIYYKYTDNLISGFLTEDANGTLINTYVNANSSYATGLEFTSQLYLTKALDLNVNLNLYNSKINLDNLEGDVVQPDALWSWFTKVNTNFKMPKGFSLQLIGQYQSKTNQAVDGDKGGGGHRGWGRGPSNNAQGYIDPFGSLDIALRKNFLKNKLSVILGVNDVFGSRYNKFYSSNNFFNQYSERISNPQLFRINLAYTFGKVDSVLFKRKSKGAEEAPE